MSSHAMLGRPTLDVSALPEHAIGHRATLWWGVVMMMTIESTMVALKIACYFYLRGNFAEWPPPRTPYPDLFWGTLNVGLFLLSLAPMIVIHRLSIVNGSKRTIILLLWLMIAIGAGNMIIRSFELDALGTRWDTDAYGSIVWWIFGFHLAHLISETLENVMLVVYLMGHKLDGRRRLDLEVGAIYWYWVVATWLLNYVVVYFVPRMF